MDYYQQGRAQASNPQSTAHYIYSTAPASGTSQTAQMYYQPPAMSHQPMQSSYQQHFQTPGSANASLDYSSQHNHQSAMTVPSGNGRGTGGRGAGARSGNGHGPVDASQIPGRYINNIPSTELPLRIVIDSKHVGAIIGTGGANIREITKESKARVVVDVHKMMKDQQGHAEKIISILGPADNTSKACVKIMEVVQHELQKDENNEINDVELKIRAHNQLVGRLIGKQGATIKKIMQETGTTIFVSNEHTSRNAQLSYGSMAPSFPDVLCMQMERTITVKGPTIENVSAAEQKITGKLRMSYETDMQNRQMTISNMPPLLLNPDPFASRIPGVYQGNQSSKVVKMWVPNSMVGAIIGAKGANIRSIMRTSGANIRIDGGGEKREKDKDEESKEDSDNSNTANEDSSKDSADKQKAGKDDKKSEDERLVTITGTDEQQYRAQFCIFQRVAEQSQHYMDDVRLRMELNVPSRLVGRIIGKGGQNVRELQRITGANVKIPEDELKEKEVNGHSSDDGKDDAGTIVRIVGTLNATQSVQCRISQLINEFNRTSIQDKSSNKKTTSSEEATNEQKQTSNAANGSGSGSE